MHRIAEDSFSYKTRSDSTRTVREMGPAGSERCTIGRQLVKRRQWTRCNGEKGKYSHSTPNDQ